MKSVSALTGFVSHPCCVQELLSGGVGPQGAYLSRHRRGAGRGRAGSLGVSAKSNRSKRPGSLAEPRPPRPRPAHLQGPRDLEQSLNKIRILPWACASWVGTDAASCFLDGGGLRCNSQDGPRPPGTMGHMGRTPQLCCEARKGRGGRTPAAGQCRPQAGRASGARPCGAPGSLHAWTAGEAGASSDVCCRITSQGHSLWAQRETGDPGCTAPPPTYFT